MLRQLVWVRSLNGIACRLQSHAFKRARASEGSMRRGGESEHSAAGCAAPGSVWSLSSALQFQHSRANAPTTGRGDDDGCPERSGCWQASPCTLTVGTEVKGRQSRAPRDRGHRGARLAATACTAHRQPCSCLGVAALAGEPAQGRYNTKCGNAVRNYSIRESQQEPSPTSSLHLEVTEHRHKPSTRLLAVCVPTRVCAERSSLS